MKNLIKVSVIALCLFSIISPQVKAQTGIRLSIGAEGVYAPQVGVLLPLGAHNYIDAGFRFEENTKFYDAGKTSNFLGLRVAYAFNL